MQQGRKPFHIVLLEPEIPANTGNIGRTCAATGSSLHLIEPLGFHLSEKNLKRAGMDYWQEVDVHRYADYKDFCARNPEAPVFYATTKAEQTYADVHYEEGAYIMFGKESAGIPEEILLAHRDRCIRIPMMDRTRSLNLSNAAAVVLYEALRQHDFAGLEKAGALHRHSWEEAEKIQPFGIL